MLASKDQPAPISSAFCTYWKVGEEKVKLRRIEEKPVRSYKGCFLEPKDFCEVGMASGNPPGSQVTNGGFGTRVSTN
jgi:hypothetical protein